MRANITNVYAKPSFNTIRPTVPEIIRSPEPPAAVTIMPVSASLSSNITLPTVREVILRPVLPAAVTITPVPVSPSFNTIHPIAPGSMKYREPPAGDITTLAPFALTVRLLLKIAIMVALPPIPAANAPSASLIPIVKCHQNPATMVVLHTTVVPSVPPAKRKFMFQSQAIFCTPTEQ